MIGRHGRHAAPVVDAGLDQAAVARLLQVGRRLDRQRVPEDQARDGHGPQQLVERRLRRIGHARVCFGAEILDDDFLQVAVRAMQVAQRDKRLDPFRAGLADADQDAGSERHLGLACGFQRREPERRNLVGRAEVRPAALAETLGRRLEHDAHRDRRLAQLREIRRVHQAGIEVRQQAGLLEDQRAHCRQIVERRGVAHRRELLGGRLPLELGLVAQGEQRLGAAGGLACARDLEHLLGRQIGRLAALGRMHEGAVAAVVAAQMRERNEHLLGEGHASAEGLVADRRGALHQRSQILGQQGLELRQHGGTPGTRDDRQRGKRDRRACRCRGPNRGGAESRVRGPPCARSRRGR